MQRTFDVLIIGSGLAGLTTALTLAAKRKVAVLSKRELVSGSSDWAQGGIAAVMSEEDSTDSHFEDTMVAGAQLSDRDAVRFVVDNGQSAIQWLVDQGVEFTTENDELHLTREGGHSYRRIVHAADATGHAIQKRLTELAAQHPNITVLEHHIAVDLITGKHVGRLRGNLSRAEARSCHGAYALNIKTGEVSALRASQTVLATGGAGKVYLFTTNPDSSTGDGIAMAWRAGCRVANMEFMQFHPTCLFHPAAKSFLITEAVRGEGGILRIPPKNGEPWQNGHRFMPEHDERAELAPRDIVARAIDYEIKKRGLDYVHLDITHKGADFIKAHFPTIHAKLLSFGIDMTTQPIPVVPAAHYTCGGVVTDLAGRTDITNLYSIGECAYTGLHGANRLASNSLLECVVFGRSAAEDILGRERSDAAAVPDWDESRVTDADEEVVITNNWDELRRFMWNYVGIVRTTKRLERAAHRIALLRQEIDEFYGSFRVTRDLLELRNLVDCAELIVRCALERRESRGLHFSVDYPGTAPKALPTIAVPR
ncbi:L-aspartate oxidase [Piscinibacterium candidicorallinum]|uniref:L-aspartate oxidase n=1 Tax=Piscinibacterium candidicorallinum TaxID=1793872 RepID=A0ABV7H2G3_9BURK